MNQIKTIRAKILSHGSKTFESTLDIFREALSFIVEDIYEEWDLIDGLSSNQSGRRLDTSN